MEKKAFKNWPVKIWIGLSMKDPKKEIREPRRVLGYRRVAVRNNVDEWRQCKEFWVNWNKIIFPEAIRPPKPPKDLKIDSNGYFPWGGMRFVFVSNSKDGDEVLAVSKLVYRTWVVEGDTVNFGPGELSLRE